MIRDEIQHVALGMQVNYQGLFNYNDLMSMIDSWLRRNGYTKKVESHNEVVKDSGRNINLRLRPFKKAKSNKLEIQLWVNITDMTDAEKKMDNLTLRMQKGKVNIVMDCFVLYDMRGKWEARAEYTFIRTIFDKYLFKSKSKDYEGQVKADAIELKNEIASFLNLNKFLF
ncbi:MAG: hypothetical protein HGA85_01950 [Nanoarchaeota archaeon]|nr:hypothetical protein [Nanoarchaeota archaeon]